MPLTAEPLDLLEFARPSTGPSKFNAIAGKDDKTVRYRRWEKVADLSDLIDGVLAEEFGCGKDDLVAEFEISLGSEASANWQILSVNRNSPGGSIFLNRRIKDRLRAGRLRDAIESNKVPPYWDRYTNLLHTPNLQSPAHRRADETTLAGG